MRLAIDGERYHCMNCQRSFFHSELLDTIGRFLTASGITFLLFTFTLDASPYGRPGVGPVEIAGYVFGAVITTLGLISLYVCK
jgi:hypothetical protein